MRNLLALVVVAASLAFTPLIASAQESWSTGFSLDSEVLSEDGRYLNSFQTYDWSGFSFDLAVFRPLNFKATIDDVKTHTTCNLTGIHLSGTASYLFQNGDFVVGPRIKVSGGVIESMPLDYTIRNNCDATFGGEVGIAVGHTYTYAFGAGGAAWVSAEKLGLGTTNTVVSAWELGGGLRYALGNDWYAKVEVSHTCIGDFRSGSISVSPLPYMGISAGFGFKF